MDCFRTVASLANGTVEKILVTEGSFVYEWEPLFLIRTKNGTSYEVKIGASGVISKVNVHEGDSIISDYTLAVLKEDAQPVGCD
ncbi:hypothetical protein [Alkalihalobacillus sp. LMS39]|uniref:hypothetical protein n=1 Tax=Alkalihalobacillus sp. LMS39 TaxID=2924032 RepID=UPI001FB1D5B5|nr:hypothetical protein [Alkalihalobacillus sp. LMS39]UOE93559.1 hypothetical protein MM271_20605 [Alkalihalobacillus sp. LMS39]